MNCYLFDHRVIVIAADQPRAQVLAADAGVPFQSYAECWPLACHPPEFVGRLVEDSIEPVPDAAVPVPTPEPYTHGHLVTGPRWVAVIGIYRVITGPVVEPSERWRFESVAARDGDELERVRYATEAEARVGHQQMSVKWGAVADLEVR